MEVISYHTILVEEIGGLDILHLELNWKVEKKEREEKSRKKREKKRRKERTRSRKKKDETGRTEQRKKGKTNIVSVPPYHTIPVEETGGLVISLPELNWKVERETGRKEKKRKGAEKKRREKSSRMKRQRKTVPPYHTILVEEIRGLVILHLELNWKVKKRKKERKRVDVIRNLLTTQILMERKRKIEKRKNTFVVLPLPFFSTMTFLVPPLLSHCSNFFNFLKGYVRVGEAVAHSIEQLFGFGRMALPIESQKDVEDVKANLTMLRFANAQGKIMNDETKRKKENKMKIKHLKPKKKAERRKGITKEKREESMKKKKTMEKKEEKKAKRKKLHFNFPFFQLNIMMELQVHQCPM